MIRRIEGGEPPAAPEGANPAHRQEKKIREVDPSEKSGGSRRTKDEYVEEDQKSKPDPKLQTYNEKGEVEESSDEESDEDDEPLKIDFKALNRSLEYKPPKGTGALSDTKQKTYRDYFPETAIDINEIEGVDEEDD